MLTKLKLLIISVPWWGWVAGIVLILFLWQSRSGWAYSSKLFNLALDNIRTDRSRVVEVLEENMASYEKEINNLEAQVKKVQLGKAESDRLLAKKEAEISARDRRIDELQKKLANIIVSDDPDRLLRDLNSRGPWTIRKRTRP